MKAKRPTAYAFSVLVILALFSAHAHTQAALLMEQPYGFFGALNPTGHNALYFERICPETPVKLRRCEPGERGSVIARYQGIAGYDWIAIPLIPYLYSVEDSAQVPARVDRDTVNRMRARYHEAHLLSLGEDVPAGGFLHGGWTELVGVAYERRIYAFRFNTTEDQDDALIARLNSRENQTRFELLYSNCSDFARVTLDQYFPGTFRRNFFPDAGMTTPKQLAWKLERYARMHPETELAVFEIPQVPGYRHLSRANKSVAESLITTTYAVPIVLINPYLAGGLFVDYLVRARHRIVPVDPPLLGPDNLNALTSSRTVAQNPLSTGTQAPGATESGSAELGDPPQVNSGPKEMLAPHE
ncbi:MAG: hypothetical protein ABR923_01610 [Terracidiphilus sp.]|jgi:hypothetical protein